MTVAEMSQVKGKISRMADIISYQKFTNKGTKN